MAAASPSVISGSEILVVIFTPRFRLGLRAATAALIMSLLSTNDPWSCNQRPPSRQASLARVVATAVGDLGPRERRRGIGCIRPVSIHPPHWGSVEGDGRLIIVGDCSIGLGVAGPVYPVQFRLGRGQRGW
jgi:hypothetical protein